jgi:hypothetical protein
VLDEVIKNRSKPIGSEPTTNVRSVENVIQHECSPFGPWDLGKAFIFMLSGAENYAAKDGSKSVETQPRCAQVSIISRFA